MYRSTPRVAWAATAAVRQYQRQHTHRLRVAAASMSTSQRAKAAGTAGNDGSSTGGAALFFAACATTLASAIYTLQQDDASSGPDAVVGSTLTGTRNINEDADCKRLGLPTPAAAQLTKVVRVPNMLSTEEIDALKGYISYVLVLLVGVMEMAKDALRTEVPRSYGGVCATLSSSAAIDPMQENRPATTRLAHTRGAPRLVLTISAKLPYHVILLHCRSAECFSVTCASFEE